MARSAVNAEQDISDPEYGIKANSVTQFDSGICSFDSAEVVTIVQKVIAEVCGTYFVIFSGRGSVAANQVYGGTVTFPGIFITWGLIVMCIRLLYDVDKDKYFGTVPAGSDIQSFVIEIIIAFLQMFVVCGVATDTRAVGELAGVAVGSSVMLNVCGQVFFQLPPKHPRPMSGASLNPARSLGPAIVMNVYKGLWVYTVAPFVGSIAGGYVYGMIRITDKPLAEIAKTVSMRRGLE